MNKHMGYLFAGVMLSILTACGGGDDGSSKAYLVSPSSLSFTGELDGVTPAAKTITITANEADTIPPDIYASGEAIDTSITTFNACPNDSSNLDCIADSSSMTVTVPVPPPNTIGVGTFSGSVLIQSSERTVTVPVTYTVTAGTLTVDQVSPTPVIAGQTGEIMIRGHGFMAFGSTVPTVTIGSTTATNVQIVNNSTITATYPALTAGEYNLAVTGGSLVAPSTAKVVVIDSQVFNAEAISNSLTVNSLIYDSIHNSIYLLKTGGVIQNLTYSSGSWGSAPISTTITGVEAIALSIDGSSLVAGGYNMLYQLNPADLTTTSSKQVTTPISPYATGCDYVPCFDSMARTSHGEIIALDNNQWQSFYFYNLASNTLTSSEDYFGYDVYVSWIWGGRLYGSENGNRTLITQGLGYNYEVYDDVTRTLTPIDVTSGSTIGVSADGKVIIVGTAILKDNGDGNGYVSHGTLPVSPAGIAISPDGLTANVLLSTGGTTVRPYDISQPAVVTPGTDITLTAAPGTNPKMTVSPDGNTLFLAGSSNIVIQPLN